MREIEKLDGGHVWSMKAGKISKNRNKQTSYQEHEKTAQFP